MRGDRSFSVQGFSERIDHAPPEGITDRDLRDLAGALDLVAFLDALIFPEDHDADVVRLEIKDEPHGSLMKGDEFAGHDLVEAVNAGDAVTDLQYVADRLHFKFGLVFLDLFFDRLRDFFG